jgi:hypothetical protein
MELVSRRAAVSIGMPFIVDVESDAAALVVSDFRLQLTLARTRAVATKTTVSRLRVKQLRA